MSALRAKTPHSSRLSTVNRSKCVDMPAKIMWLSSMCGKRNLVYGRKLTLDTITVAQPGWYTRFFDTACLIEQIYWNTNVFSTVIPQNIRVTHELNGEGKIKWLWWFGRVGVSGSRRTNISFECYFSQLPLVKSVFVMLSDDLCMLI